MKKKICQLISFLRDLARYFVRPLKQIEIKRKNISQKITTMIVSEEINRKPTLLKATIKKTKLDYSV